MNRILVTLSAVLGAAAIACAQCVPPTTFQTNDLFNGDTFFGAGALDPGPCSYFDLDVKAGVTITQLGLDFNNTTLVGTTARAEMWIVDITNGLNGGTVTANIPRVYSITNGTQPGAPWALAASSAFTVAPSNVPSLTTGFSLHLNPGTYGVCLVTVPNGTAPGSMAPATNRLLPLFTNVGLGSPLLVVSDQVFTFTGRGVRSIGFASSPAAQYLPNIRMQYVLDANNAYSTTYGTGCYESPKTFYQGFDGPAIPGGAAPAITTAVPHMTMQPVGSPVARYRVQPGTGSYPLVAPGSTTWYDTLAPLGATATHANNRNPAVTLFGGWDDAMSVAYPLPFALQHPGGIANAISICSNGAVYLNSTSGSIQFFHRYAEFCAGPACYAVGLGDLWPADNVTFTGGAGDIWVDSDGSTFVAVTWDHCIEYPSTANATAVNSFQVVFRSTGVVDYVWANLKNSDAAPVLIGYTPGNGSPDPGVGLPSPRAEPNLAVVVPGQYLSGDGSVPPRLVAANRPRVGSGLTLTTSNLDASVVAGITFVSTGSLPGIDLAAAGMPGCRLNIVLPEVLSSLGLSFGGSISANITGTGVIPAAVTGLDFYAQTGCLSTRAPAYNSANVVVSQGLCLHVAIN